MLPNLIITGFPKCGTTSLFTWLADHPQVAGSSVKETNYFVDPGTHSFESRSNFRDHGLSGYNAFFPAETDAKIIMEATPQYAYQATALSELPRLESNPILLFIIRNPADQIFSLYTYYRSNFTFLNASISFAQFMKMVERKDPELSNNELLRDALENCDYELHLDKWQAAIGKERILTYVFEDIKADKRIFMNELANRLDIDESFYENYSFPLENYSYKLRSYRLHQLNVFIRGLLPISQRSSVWRKLRSVYRTLNTRPDDKKMSKEDQDAFNALNEQWASRYQRLMHRYGLFQNARESAVADLPSAGLSYSRN